MKIGTLNIIDKSVLSHSLETIVENEKIKLNKEVLDSTLNSNEISNCLRSLAYKSIKLNKNNLSIEKHHNKFVIEKWCNLLKYYVKAKNIYLSDCNYNLVGNGDIMIEIDYHNILLKIQSVNNNDFKYVLTKGAFKKDVLELMINEWLVEVDEGLLIYENRDDLKFEVFQVYLFTQIIESVKSKCKDLMECKIRGELPPRPYKKNNGKECKNCDYSEECWKS